jgi:hypothetical protein
MVIVHNFVENPTVVAENMKYVVLVAFFAGGAWYWFKNRDHDKVEKRYM